VTLRHVISRPPLHRWQSCKTMSTTTMSFKLTQYKPKVRKAMARIRGDMLEPRNWDRTGCDEETMSELGGWEGCELPSTTTALLHALNWSAYDTKSTAKANSSNFQCSYLSYYLQGWQLPVTEFSQSMVPVSGINHCAQSHLLHLYDFSTAVLLIIFRYWPIKVIKKHKMKIIK